MSSVVTTLEDIDAIKGGEDNFQPGDFKLVYCSLHHGPGKEYPIGNLVTSIHLFEDIETIGINGWLEMEDDLNLVESGLLIGEELLYMKFETGGASEAGHPEFAVDYSEHPLYIHGIQNIGFKVTQSGKTTPTLTYRIHFCSTETMSNNRTRLSKTYKGIYSDIVTDILENDLKTIKPVHTRDTLDIRHVVAPNLRPFDLIASFIPSSQRKEVNAFWGEFDMTAAGQEQIFRGRRSDYGFYETVCRSDKSGGFHYMPLNTSRDKSLSFTLTVQDSTLGEGGASATLAGLPGSYLRAYSYDFIETGDKLGSIRSGVWASKLIEHDALTKSFDIYKSDYIKQLKEYRFSHAATTPVYDPKGAEKTLSEFPDGALRLTSYTSDKTSNINKNNGKLEYPWSSSGIAVPLHRQMQVGHLLGYQRLEVTLPGLSGLSVGMGAGAKFPDVGMRGGQKGDLKSLRVHENRFTNSWIITKVAHIIDLRVETPFYNTIVEMANTMGSTFEDLPTNGKLGTGGRAF